MRMLIGYHTFLQRVGRQRWCHARSTWHCEGRNGLSAALAFLLCGHLKHAEQLQPAACEGLCEGISRTQVLHCKDAARLCCWLMLLLRVPLQVRMPLRLPKAAPLLMLLHGCIQIGHRKCGRNAESKLLDFEKAEATANAAKARVQSVIKCQALIKCIAPVTGRRMQRPRRQPEPPMQHGLNACIEDMHLENCSSCP